LLAVIVHTASITPDLPAQASGTQAFPGTATSIYVTRLDAGHLKHLGCDLGRAAIRSRRLRDLLVVLDFGRPTGRKRSEGTRAWGGRFHTTDQIQGAAQAYGDGFLRCTVRVPDARIRVAIGTSNYGRHVTFSHGKAWALMVNEANQWALERGAAARLDFAGANDIELGWNGPVRARRWVAGYDSVAHSPYYDYGDAAGCPPAGRCLGAWSVEDVWWVSWGAPSAFPLPEIYSPTGINATQWQFLSLYSYLRHGSAMRIAGPLSQRVACRQSRDSCRGTNNSPGRAWSLLWGALNRDRRTAQSLRWSADMRWQH
jgi:hypothetical protein